MKAIILLTTLALSACATSTVQMPDGSLHTCRHYLDGIVMLDRSDTDDATRACRVVGVQRMDGGAK